MSADTPAAYQVLARKYRPGHFRDLVGQEIMVETLRNAFEHDRIAHAFMLTGVRGIGKTTTARIIAKGLNCERDGRPTIDPCGVCDACVSIAAGQNVDVIEMDAASNTGVDDVREIVDAVRYRAATARYKVYIVDEVHMLSTNAFNALLKTLEEPPPHVKFVFATTEIRKVPVTVLSRCQRFDLRRIEPEEMLAFLGRIAAAEGAAFAEDALALIGRASEGSARDALSLLDQAIAIDAGEAGAIPADRVRAMLGLADRGRVIDLFEAIMRGDAAGALQELGAQYADGADPGVVLKDLAELTHWVSLLKISEDLGDDPTLSGDERARGRDLASRLGMRALTRTWQMLLKALEELPLAPNPMMAAEMAVIRLTHVADLPSPEDLVRRLDGLPAAPTATSGAHSGGSGGGVSAQLVSGGGSGSVAVPAPMPSSPPTAMAEPAGPADFPAAVAAIRESRDLKLAVDMERHVSVVSYRPGRIEFAPVGAAPNDLAGRMGTALSALTGTRWSVLVSAEAGQRTLGEEREADEDALRARAYDHPLVAAALAAFPDAAIAALRPLTEPEPAADVLQPITEIDDFDGDLLDREDPFEEEN